MRSSDWSSDVCSSDLDEQAGLRKPLLDYMDSGGKPTALFCAHDGIAVSVISELALLGIRVPEDVSWVGFNDFISASQVAPRLPTIRTPHVEMGSPMDERKSVGRGKSEYERVML